MGSRFYQRVVNNLDISLAIISLLGGLALVLLAPVKNNPQYAAVGIILLVASVVYLFIRRGAGLTDTSEARASSLHLLLNILFFSALIFSILALYLRPDTYARPMNYFIAIVVMVGILAAEILFLPRSKPYSYLVLAKIVLIPLSLTWSQLLLFPAFLGDDPWWHQAFTQQIIDTGFIPGSAGYARIPVMHLLSGTTELVTGLDYKMAALFSISSMHIICLLLFAFLLGRFIFNAKAGLLAALFLGISVDFVSMSFLVLPNTFAAFMMLAIVYILFKLRATKPFAAVLLSILIMAALILTHTIVSLCMAILLLALCVGFAVYNSAHKRMGSPVTLGIAILFIVATFGWWTYSSGHLAFLTDLVSWGFSLDYWLPPAAFYEALAPYTYQVPAFESLFNSIGRYLFIGLALPGCFYLLSKKISRPHAFSFAFGALIITAIAFIASVFQYEIQTGRWHYFIQILLSVPLGVSLLLFFDRIKNGAGKALPVALLAAVIAFLTVMSPIANMDSPYFKETVVRKAYTESELQAMDTTLGLTDRALAVDDNTASHLPFLPRFASEPITSIGERLYRQDFTDLHGSLIAIRRFLSQETIRVGLNTYTRLDYDPAQTLADEGYSRVYDVGTVSAFYWNDGEPSSQGQP